MVSNARWSLAGLVLACACVWPGAGVAAAEPPAKEADPPKDGPNLAEVSKQVVAATNQFRKQEGRPELKVNAELTRAAQYFADFMARTDKYSHTADDKQPWDRAAEYGYKYCIVAENIAYQFNSEGFTTRELTDGFIEGWKKSPHHRENMLDPDVDDIGVGVARSATTGRYYAVQDFGRPKSKEIKFQITNQAGDTLEYTLAGKTYSIKPDYTVTHETCRPPDLVFPFTGGAEKPAKEKAKTFHPKPGARYVIAKDDSGKYTVQEK
jgi:uncharacterized protein YkwD